MKMLKHITTPCINILDISCVHLHDCTDSQGCEKAVPVNPTLVAEVLKSIEHVNANRAYFSGK